MVKFFADSFDKLAEVVRILYVYGCFSNDDFDDPVIREKINEFIINSSYAYRKSKDFLIKKLKDIIDDKHEGMTKHSFISMDRFESGSERIAQLYRLCSKKQMNRPIFDYAKYLKNISENKKTGCRSVKEYFGKDTSAASLFFMEIGKSRFTDEELSQLYAALMFYNGKAPYSVSGFFACDRINDYLKLSGKSIITNEATPVFTHNNVDRIVNDNSVSTIFEAIKERKYISYISRKKEVEALRKQNNSQKNNKFVSEHIEIFPLKIVYEFQNGRGYLIFWQNTIRMCRLDHMYDVTISKRKIDSNELKVINEKLNAVLDRFWISISKGKSGHILIDFDERMNEMQKLIPVGQLDKTERRKCRYEADLMNYKDIIPFLRRFGEKAHISKEASPELYNIIKSDIEEALKNYGAL